MSGLQGVLGAAQTNNFAAAPFMVTGATAADWEKAKNLFRYFARTAENADVTQPQYVITKENLGLRIWEAVCEARGVDPKNCQPFDFQRDSNTVLSLKEVTFVENKFSNGFTMRDLIPFPKLTLGEYTDIVLKRMSYAGVASWQAFGDFMATYARGADKELFRSLGFQFKK